MPKSGASPHSGYPSTSRRPATRLPSVAMSWSTLFDCHYCCYYYHYYYSITITIITTITVFMTMYYYEYHYH